MTRVTRRRIALLATVIVGAPALVYVARVASILTAYKAKMLCSEVLLAHRDPKVVTTELEVDDLAPLRIISASVDSSARMTRASLAGLFTRRAAFVDGRGCVLQLEPRASPDAPQARDEAGVDVRVPARIDHSLDAVLDRAFAEPDPDRPRRTRAVVVLREGQIVAERYADGFGADTPLLGWSMAKTVTNALVGILVNEGRLSIDQPVPIPEWQADGDPRRQITLGHLLHMSSGLDFNESAANPVSDVTVMLLGSPSAGTYAAGKRLAAAPGTVWQYSSGTTNIISRVIRRVINDDTRYLAFPRAALFDRIGMSHAVLETDAGGTFVGSSFMYATARDWARLGQLYVQDGVWNGQRILPEGWVTYTRSPAPADVQQRYGAHVWLKIADQYSGGAELPADALHAAGHAGQFVTMIPSLELVVVRLGLTRYPEAWDQAGFVREVLIALTGATPGT